MQAEVAVMQALAGQVEGSTVLRYKKKMVMWGPAVMGYCMMTMMLRNGLQALAQASRDRDAGDVGTKAAVCAALGLNVAALYGEGLVIHAPQRAPLLQALYEAGVDGVFSDFTKLNHDARAKFLATRTGA